MKKILKIMGVLILVFSIIGFSIGCTNQQQDENAETPQGRFKPGTYEGSEKGHGGPVTAKVTVTEDEITNIEIDAPDETPSIAGSASEEIISRIIDTQSLDVEAVSGATISSTAMI